MNARLKFQRGQSLVETAIIAPVVIFMLIGVFEVGWALRGYLVLANASREAARFAVRPGYVDYDSAQPNYEPIVAHTFTTLSGQIEFMPAGVIIVSRIRIDTDYPCDPKKIFDSNSPDYLKCNCTHAVKHPYTATVAISPLEVPTYTFTWPPTATKISRLDYRIIKQNLITANLVFNCNLMNRTPYARPGMDDVIYVEMIWEQPQLFGFPLISNPFTDPVPMYAHTAMRRIVGR